MVEKFGAWMAQVLVCNRVIKKQEAGIYEYGVTVLVYTLINLATILLIGIVMGCVWESMCYTVCYIVLRKFVGGYHAQSPISCYIVSTTMFSASCFLLVHSEISIYCLGIIIILALLCGRIIPVETENKALSVKEREMYRIIGTIIFGVEVILCVLAYRYEYLSYFNSIILAMICCEILVVVGAVYNRVKG